jgi:16S rRNA (cytidine1402-2'-O)-methyltransferase
MPNEASPSPQTSARAEPPDDAPEEASAALQPGRPGLVLVSTPIGNLADVTFRAIAALQGADLILCEDTRTTARLLAHHAITTRTAPLHDHNEDARIPDIIARLAAGARIALVSDAGTPLVSDPGYRLVRAAIAAGHHVDAMPGANAATTALILSGLPPHPYLFLGFPPPRQAARLAAFATLRAAERAGLSATLIWYEAPHRLSETLADMHTTFGPRPAAIARELTKRFEEVRRATLADLATHYATHAPRGEITLVVGPAPPEEADTADLDTLLRGALKTQSVREAAAGVAAATGLPRRRVYARALEMQSE